MVRRFRRSGEAGLLLAASFAFVAAAGPMRVSPDVRAERRSQRPTLIVVVRDSGTAQPLINSDVVDLDPERHHLTDEKGEARLSWPSDGRLRVRVRQIGYTPVERVLTRAPGAATDTLVLSLLRVAYTLPKVFANTGCNQRADAESALLSASMLEQLRISAERYRSFSNAYPFRAMLERRTATVRSDKELGAIRRQQEGVNSDRWGDPYVPDHVVERGPLGFSVPILFVATLADSIFWERHCFVVRGIEDLRGRRVLRMEFSPTSSVRSIDWSGVALIDSASSVLRRLEFRLSGLRESDEPRRLDGYTTFISPSPYVVLPETTVAVWWRHGPDAKGEWGTPNVVQSLSLRDVKYMGAAPPKPNAP